MVTDYEPYIERCGNAPEDRHVLAAAIRERAPTILTINLKDFPVSTLEPWDVVATHPSDYLITLLEHRPAIVTSKLRDMAERRNRTLPEMLAILEKTVPSFCASVRAELGIGPKFV